MGEHWSCEEKCDVGMHVILLQHIVNRWQTFHVFVHGIRRTQKCAELNQCVLALIVQFAHQFKMIVCRFTIDDAVLLLCHQEAQSDCQIVAGQSIFQSLRWFFRIPHLTEVAGLLRIENDLLSALNAADGFRAILTSLRNNSPPAIASNCSDVITSVASMPVIFWHTSFRISKSKL